MFFGKLAFYPILIVLNGRFGFYSQVYTYRCEIMSRKELKKKLFHEIFTPLLLSYVKKSHFFDVFFRLHAIAAIFVTFSTKIIKLGWY